MENQFDDPVPHDVYSQYGEDGLIDWLVGRIEIAHRICVEFGAWDGQRLSNTFNLVKNSGWKALYIEGDPKKYAALKATAAAYPAITPEKAFVVAKGTNSLDFILTKHNLPYNFEVLSIDVDGADYDIWEGLNHYQPLIVIIEHNQSMPPGFEHVDRDGAGHIGSSATSLNKLAKSKGYDLFACTITNSIYLRNDLFAKLGRSPTTVERAFDKKFVCYAFKNASDELVFSNPEFTKNIRSVNYASLPKWIKHSVFRNKSFYALDEHYKEGYFTKVVRQLRRIG